MPCNEQPLAKRNPLHYMNYLERAEGSGHKKPFLYYAQLLGWKKMELYTWSELLILTLAAVGALSTFLRHDLPERTQVFLRLLAAYALLTLLIYSVIPYKTPWSILAFLHAAILLAGFGFSSLIKLCGTIPRFIFLGYPHPNQHCTTRCTTSTLRFFFGKFTVRTK